MGCSRILDGQADALGHYARTRRGHPKLGKNINLIKIMDARDKLDYDV